MKRKKTAGITLMELVVVLAIVAIIGAIVVPHFIGMTEIARLRADLQSTMVLDNGFQLYRLQHPGPNTDGIQEVLNLLNAQDFIAAPVRAAATSTGEGAPPQTPGAEWRIVQGHIRLYLPADLLGAHWDSLTHQEQQMVANPGS